MKRFRFKQTGEPLAVLTLEDAPTPTPGDDEVLVRVLLAPIHPSGSVKPIVERVYPLGEADEALRHLIEDRPFGKVALAG
jgi:NADPH:quinone reductase-like Zn-dependent oxidoreductase